MAPWSLKTNAAMVL